MVIIQNILFSCTLLLLTASALAQDKVVWSDQEKPIVEQLRGLRKLDDTVRVRTTKELALQIRALPIVPNKLKLAGALAESVDRRRLWERHFAGSHHHSRRRHCASSLPQENLGSPTSCMWNWLPWCGTNICRPLRTILSLPRRWRNLEADDAKRQNADFTLSDLQGKAWHLQELRGKVVLVNFWATWCPPCRKEMPDLDALYNKFKDQGFVVLAISDEETAKVSPYIAEHKDQLSSAARSRAQGE